MPPKKGIKLFMVKNTVKAIEHAKNSINEKYDLYAHNIDAIAKISKCTYDAICNGFYFGYIQGLKSTGKEK